MELRWDFDDDGERVATPGTHTLTVVVDATDVVAETDETNNSYTRTVVVIDDP